MSLEEVYNILDVKENLQLARDLSTLASHENKISMYESAYKIIEDSWQTLQEAEKFLDNQFQGTYLRTANREDFLEVPFQTNIEELDEDSNPSTIGLALPQLYEELLDTREYVMKKHRNSGIEINTSEYLSPQIDYVDEELQ